MTKCVKCRGVGKLLVILLCEDCGSLYPESRLWVTARCDLCRKRTDVHPENFCDDCFEQLRGES
jgi:hypothetical protein